MNELVASQRNYFQQGHTRPLALRKSHLRKLRELLMENEKMLADAIYKDFKKSYYVTVENEISLPCGEINRFIRNLNRWSRPKYVRSNLVNFPASSRVVPVPYGVTLVIGPWNYPYMLSLIPAISSLAAGNTVILKPSEVTAHSSAALAALINDHFPRELFHVVEGGEEVATALLKERFDKIFFTGSSRVGRIVMQAAALHLTPVTLELGGKNPVIVMPDCDVRKTALRLAWGKLHNNGSACVAPDHVFVHRSVKEELIRELKRSFAYILEGDPRNSPIIPRIINEGEFDRIHALIDHERVVAGGTIDREERFIEPTLLDGVDPGDPVMQEEIFGPLLPLITFDHLDEVLNSFNGKPSPLAVYIFSRDIRKSKRLLKHLPSGGGMVNEVVLQFVNMNTPFGGIGASGMGNYHGKAGFNTFSHQKTILTKPYWFDLYLKYPPYRSFNLRVIKTVFGRSIRHFLK